MSSNSEQEKIKDIVDARAKELKEVFAGRHGEGEDIHAKIAAKRTLDQRGDYYIPSTGDICVGYECEVNQSTDLRNPKWEKIRVIPTTIYGVLRMLELGNIRTARLSVEQLEKEGWEKLDIRTNHFHSGDPTIGRERIAFQRGNYFLVVFPDNSFISMIFKDPSKEDIWGIAPENFHFKAIVPSINEFRTICKMLNIT